jgi:hypothetical protein
VAQVLDHARRPKDVPAGTSAGIILDREVDVSRGDWILAAPTAAAAPAADDDFGDTPAATPAPALTDSPPAKEENLEPVLRAGGGDGDEGDKATAS